jgi:hypothetical protein
MKRESEYPIFATDRSGHPPAEGYISSFSSVYNHLKSLGLIEPYERRPSPLKDQDTIYAKETSCGAVTGQGFL